MPVEPESPRRASGALGVALRWALTLAIALGGAWAARRVIFALRARAGTRLVVLDFARFDGCLLGAPPASDGDVPDRAVALAQGTGDPLWPHSCSPALTALVHDAHEVADDDARAEPLARDADAMDAALGEAVFWNEHVREGHVEPPAWIGAYVSLRRSVDAFARQRATTRRPPEPPRHPRVPKPPDRTPPAPVAVAVPGGDEAEIVDTLATPTTLAALLRDLHGRTTLCRIDVRAPRPEVACRELQLAPAYEVASVRFVPSAAGVWIAAAMRAPDARRALLDPADGRVVLAPGGEPAPDRDFFVAADGSAWALSLDARVPTLLASRGEARGSRSLPASLDVLATQRAMLPVDGLGAPLIAWLDVRSPTHATLRAFDPLRARASVVASWAAPTMVGLDRALVPCRVPGGGAFVLAGDGRGVTVFATSPSRTLVRGPSLAVPLAGLGVACDAGGVSLHRETGAGHVALFRCDAVACRAGALIDAADPVSYARAAGSLLVATAPSRGAARVVRVTDGAPAEAALPAEPVAAHSLALVATADGAAALFASAEHTHVLFARDGGASFEALPVARP